MLEWASEVAKAARGMTSADNREPHAHSPQVCREDPWHVGRSPVGQVEVVGHVCRHQREAKVEQAPVVDQVGRHLTDGAEHERRRERREGLVPQDRHPPRPHVPDGIGLTHACAHSRPARGAQQTCRGARSPDIVSQVSQKLPATWHNNRGDEDATTGEPDHA
jgi:hypothetical protein